MPGTLVNVNTLERFRAFDRGTLMSNAAKRLVEDIRSGRADDDAALLTPFIALTYADLKKWSFYYWFAFPALKLDVPAKVISARPARGTRRARRRRRRDIARMRGDASARRERPGAHVVDRR